MEQNKELSLYISNLIEQANKNITNKDIKLELVTQHNVSEKQIKKKIENLFNQPIIEKTRLVRFITVDGLKEFHNLMKEEGNKIIQELELQEKLEKDRQDKIIIDARRCH